MRALRSPVLWMLAAACVLSMACQTAGTPKQADRPPTETRASGDPKAAPPKVSASLHKSDSSAKGARPAAAATRQARAGKSVAKAAKRPGAAVGQPLLSMRIVLFATLGVILLIALVAIAAERAGRRRKLAPAPAGAMRSAKAFQSPRVAA